jgi:fermentation-respiration switch protein FrsA (DUF1100 family)
MLFAMWEKAKNILKRAVGFYVLLLLAMTLGQRYLMYHPSSDLKAPEYYGLDAEKVSLSTPDGETLVAWYFPAENSARPTLLHLHGNAKNIANRKPVYEAFYAAGYGVLALEWRGYGTSTGSPTEEGFYTDARTAIAWLEDKGIGQENIILYGESIGTGTAVQMATEIEAKALILEAPFTSLWERAAEIHWYLPVKYLVWDQYDNMGKINDVEEPVLIFHNQHDPVVPSRHGKALYAAANEPKRLELVDRVGHVSFDRKWQLDRVDAFLQ